MKPFLNQNLFHLNKTYLLAVSFGPDSMALLHRFYREGYRIEVAHINYHLRSESNLEQSQLEQYCLHHDIPLHVLDVKTFPKGNLQEEARKIRYDFFKKIALEIKADAILTAHHQDDDLETAIMQHQRSTLYEYFGIRPVGFWEGMKVYRPLLNQTKQNLIEYCHEYNVPYAIDSSNAKLIYQRNRIRNHLHSLSSAEKEHKIELFKNENNQRDKIIQFLKIHLSKRTISIAIYSKWNLLTKFLYWLSVNQFRGIHFPITQSWLRKIDQNLSSQKPNIMIKYASGWHLEKAYDQLWLIRDDDLVSYHFTNPKGKVTLPLLNINIDTMVNLPNQFVLRSCLPQDKLKIKSYTKPFRRLAIDWKMPLFLRRVWPIFTKPNGDIILLPRYQKNHDFKANNWLEILE
ncbi:MAG: tRNA lysidine(34) synthetase TilS [Bacilli bacterium]